MLAALSFQDECGSPAVSRRELLPLCTMAAAVGLGPLAAEPLSAWGCDVTTKAAIDAFVALPALAIDGVSRSGKKFGNAACRELRARGYRVYPIHPSADVIDGVRCYSRFADLPEPVDAALVVVPPAESSAVVREAPAAGIHHVWLQQGAESVDVLQTCHNLGLTFVWGECILMFTQPTGIHKAHQWLWRVLGKLPA